MTNWSVIALSPPPAIEIGRFQTIEEAGQAIDALWGKQAPAPKKAGGIPAGARISDWRDDRFALLTRKDGKQVGEVMILESRYWDAGEPPLVWSKWRWSNVFGFEPILIDYMAAALGLSDELIGRPTGMRPAWTLTDPKATEAYSLTWEREIVPWAAKILESIGVNPSTYSGDRVWPDDVRKMAAAADSSGTPWGAALAQSLRQFVKEAADEDEGTYAKMFAQERLKWTFPNAVWQAFCWMC